MRITTWNINSIRARAHLLPAWLDRERPDVLCLQELKCVDAQFPHDVFASRGYHVSLLGQKTYNGVAIASLLPQTDVRSGFPLDDDPSARGIAATIGGVRVVNVYVVNGKEVGDEKYHHKLRWLAGLRDVMGAELAAGLPTVLCGDFNIAPTDDDVWDVDKWRGRILCSEPERSAWRALLALGLTDAWNVHQSGVPAPYRFTWWDYRGGGFDAEHGLRIDTHLVSAGLVERVRGLEIDRRIRAHEKPSDHAPVTLRLGWPEAWAQ